VLARSECPRHVPFGLFPDEFTKYSISVRRKTISKGNFSINLASRLLKTGSLVFLIPANSISSYSGIFYFLNYYVPELE
jgi:hypothetical protein